MVRFFIAPGLTLLMLLLGGCNEDSPVVRPSSAPAPRQTGATLKVGLEAWPETVQVQGSLYGDEQAVVGAKVAGLVKAVKVDLGSPVKQGDILAELEMEHFDLRVRHVEAQVQSIRAKLGLKPGQDDAKLDRMNAPPVRQERTVRDEARGKAERARRLAAQKAIATEEAENLEAALRVAEAKLDSALNLVEEQVALLHVMKQELAQALQTRQDATIRAPFDGVVQQRFAAPGVYLQVGAPVASLVRTNPVRFRAGVPERVALRVAVRQPVHLEVQELKDPVTAVISRIAPALELNNRALTVEVDLPNPAGLLRPGLFAQGTITTNPAARTLAIPLGAVTTFAGVDKVWKVEKGPPREVRIRTGRRDQGRVEVLGGLKAGDIILAEPPG